MDYCLICFRLVSPDENNLLGDQNDEEKLKDFQRFFKMLNRHLKIDEIEINGDINKTAFSNFENAPACEECMKEMNSFCELYHKIKTLELILNQKLRMLTNIMFCAGKVPARVACFKETFSNKLDTSGPSTDEKVNELLQYKKILIAKCSEKLSRTYPKLILKRIANPIDDEGQRAFISEKVSLQLPSISPATASTTAFEEEVEASSVECDISSQIDAADFSNPSSPALDNVSFGILCKLEAIDEKIQMRHLNYQEEELNDEFLIELGDVKPNHISSEAILPSTRRSLRTIHKCSKCRRTFSSLDKLSIHQSTETCNEEKQSKIESDSEHDDDADNLLFKNESGNDSSSTDGEHEEDVKLYSENESKSSKVKSRLAKRRNPKAKNLFRMFPGDVCPVCQKVIPTLPNSTVALKDEMISQHILQDHPEAFKTAGTPQPFSCPVFYCPFAFDNVRSLTNHCSLKHKPEFKLRLRYEVKDHLVRDLENPLHCPFLNCDAACLNRPVLTIHLKSAHESEWNPKTLTILSRKFFTERMKIMDKPVKSSSMQLDDSDLDGEKEVLKPKKLRTKCPECSKFFSTFYEMIFHRKQIHFIQRNKAEALQKKEKLTIEILNIKEETSEKAENQFEIYSKIEIDDSKVFSCPEGNPPCEQLFLLREDLEAHLKLHGEFKCQSCEFTEENAVKLAEHELKNHTENGDSRKETEFVINLSCPRCEEKFCRKYKYLEHFVTEHLNLERLMEQCCPICRDPYGNPSWTSEMKSRDEYRHLFNYHNLLLVKDPKDILQCKESGCFAYFLKPSQLRKHTRIVHSSEKNSRKFYKHFKTKLECKDCGKVLKGRRVMRLHRLRVHVKDADKISCSVEGCQQKFELEKELTAHLKYFHIDQNRIRIQICPKCGMSIKGAGSFQLHMNAHFRKEKAEADGLMRWVCESCGKGFKSKCSLDQHIRLRHEGPKNWKFQCKTCNKKCLNLAKLNEHMRTHTNEKPFICQVCGAAYGHRHNLRIHVNNKHGDVMQDIPKKRDTSNLFRRKNNSKGESTQKKVKSKKVPQKEKESDFD